MSEEKEDEGKAISVGEGNVERSRWKVKHVHFAEGYTPLVICPSWIAGTHPLTEKHPFSVY